MQKVIKHLRLEINLILKVIILEQRVRLHMLKELVQKLLSTQLMLKVVRRKLQETSPMPRDYSLLQVVIELMQKGGVQKQKYPVLTLLVLLQSLDM